jgi:hypothetical protein
MRTPAFFRTGRTASLPALIVCAGLMGPTLPAWSADPTPAPPAAAGFIDLSWWVQQPVSLAGYALKSVGTGAASMWGLITDAVTPFQPADALPERISDDDRRFFAVLDALGLQLSEIKVGGTVVSSSVYRLVAAREPSDADIERAERRLDEYRATSGGLRAKAKQRIARSVLDLASDKGFVVTALVVGLSPWPSVNYEMNARSRPPEPAERRVLESLQVQ